MEAAAVIAASHDGSLMLRISVTDRCQLRCEYCMPEDGIALCRHEDMLSYEEIRDCVRVFHEWKGLRKVRITGGDPLVRRDIEVFVAMLAQLGIPDIAMTTNGQRLESFAAPLKSAGLQRVNVSLDSLNPETYRRLSRGGSLDRARAGIEAALRCGLRPVKLNMVVMRGVNDIEVGEMLAFALDSGCEIRFLELMPIGVAASLHAARFIASSEILARISAVYALSPLPFDPTSTARRFAVVDGQGRKGVAGFVSPCSDSFCQGCRRLRLTADGQLVGCLAGSKSIDIRALLREGSPGSLAALKNAVHSALGHKRSKPEFTRQLSIGAIGG